MRRGSLLDHIMCVVDIAEALLWAFVGIRSLAFNMKLIVLTETAVSLSIFYVNVFITTMAIYNRNDHMLDWWSS